MVSWNRCASWVTTPTTSCSESSVASRTSCPPTSTAPSTTSYSRATRWLMVVLPAPDGTDQRDHAGRAVNDTSKSTCCAGAWPSMATDSSEASETSSAVG